MQIATAAKLQKRFAHRFFPNCEDIVSSFFIGISLMGQGILQLLEAWLHNEICFGMGFRIFIERGQLYHFKAKKLPFHSFSAKQSTFLLIIKMVLFRA